MSAAAAGRAPSIAGALRRALLVASTLGVLAVPYAGLAAVQSAPASGAEGRCPLPYGGLVRRETVLSIARAAAWLDAVRQSAKTLEHAAAQYAAVTPLQREVFAAAAHRPAVTFTFAKTSAPPAGEIAVHVRLNTPPRTLDDRLREMLRHNDMTPFHGEALTQTKNAAAEGVELALRAAQARRRNGTGADSPFEERIAYLGRRLEALWILNDILTRLRNARQDPGPLLDSLRRATALDGENPLLWCASGEAQLRLDQPQHALESLNRALALQPDLARALYLRGLGHARLGRHALAEADMNAALRLASGTADWLQSRGAVRMMRGDYGPMCEDLESACALGLCDGLAAARARKLCPAGERAP